jgi:hypothetical protein
LRDEEKMDVVRQPDPENENSKKAEEKVDHYDLFYSHIFYCAFFVFQLPVANVSKDQHDKPKEVGHNRKRKKDEMSRSKEEEKVEAISKRRRTVCVF